MKAEKHDISHDHDAHHGLHFSHTDQIASKVTFGFWIYVMTDAIMFATLFAVYAVLHNNIYGGPGIKDVASLPHMLMQTIVLIVGAFTYGLSFVGFYKGKISRVFFWLAVTFLLGLLFLGIEINDCTDLMAKGYSWKNSAFLSSYFTLLAVHALHVLVALLWMFVLFFQLANQRLTVVMRTRFICLGLFWNFLNLMWITAFTIVFLMGAV
jgi:cytochrome o ubiquinol oxidase subunit 3